MTAASRAWAPLLFPIFGLLALVVPYLPGAPDWWPVLQVLAGPGRWIVWALVATQLAWVLWPWWSPRLAWFTSRSLRVHTAVIWLIAAGAATVGAARLTHTSLFPSGDEPHYLVLAQSLWRDGDLQIENNHTRGDYREYYARDLDPHFLTRGSDGEIYSVHPVGMPVLITPVLAAGGYTLVVAFFIAMAATAAAVAWRWTVATTGAPGAATLAWAAIVFSAPFLINAVTIYPEVPAALVAAVAVAIALRPTPDRRPWHDVAVSALAALLPWLSTKYAPMSVAIVAVAWGRVWWPLHASERPDRSLASLMRLGLPYGAMLAVWFAFFYAYWGTPLPSAPYGSMVQTTPANTVFGVPGLLFDQEYGLLAYAPAYVLAGFGLWTMSRRAGALRRLALEVTLVVAALTLTVGAFRIWWGGSAAPGRPMTSGLLLLMMPIAVQIGSAAHAPARRAAQHLLVWLGAALCGVLVFAQDGLLVANGRDGTSSLLEWLSPRWPIWRLAPTFIAHEAPRALADVTVWLLAVAVGSWALGRLRPASRGAASLAALVGTAVVIVAGAVGMARAAGIAHSVARRGSQRARPAGAARLVRSREPARGRALRAAAHHQRHRGRRCHGGRGCGRSAHRAASRARAAQRPLLAAGRAATAPSAQWAARDPLPARAGATIGLQVGRIGDPLRSWPVAPTPGGTWQQEFALPVDAGFVAFRGSPELERSIASLRIEALDVVDAGARTATPQVLAAAAYGGLVVLFHDGALYPEPGGFWTTGERLARMTVSCEGGCERGVVLRVHSGARPNRLRLTSHGWSQDVDLAGQQAVDVLVPPPSTGQVIEFDAITTTGFVPSDVDPAIRDRRYLGAWIEPRLPSEEFR